MLHKHHCGLMVAIMHLCMVLALMSLCCGIASAQTKANDVRKPPPEQAEERVGPLKPGTTPGCTLERVVDTRTLVVRIDGDSHRVRLIGIEAMPGNDAPAASAAFLTNMLAGETLSVVAPQGAGVAKDATPWVILRREPEGLDVALELLRQGFARLDPKFDEAAANLPASSAEQYRQAAERARGLKKGLWDPKWKPKAAPVEPGPKSETPAPSEPAAPKGGTPAKAETPATLAATVVFVTPNGKKYHLEGCKFLSKNARPMSLEEARKSYQPCSACDPPK